MVGFGTADFAILNQIASETGGPAPFSIENASQLRTVSQIINAAINCEPAPILRESRFSSPGQTRVSRFQAQRQVGPGPDQLADHWQCVQGPVRQEERQGAERERGESFVALNLKKLEKGKKFKFKIRAKKLTDPETVTAAIIR